MTTFRNVCDDYDSNLSMPSKNTVCFWENSVRSLKPVIWNKVPSEIIKIRCSNRINTAIRN